MAIHRSLERVLGRRAATTPGVARRLARAGIGCAALAWSALASAGVQQWVSVTAGNNQATTPGSIGIRAVALASQATTASRLLDTGDASQAFTGLNGDGVVEQEFYTGRAMSYAAVDSMKIGVSYSLTNRLANTANPKYVNSDFSVNPNGVPDAFRADAHIIISDSLSVTGGGDVDSLEFTYRLTGNITTFGTEFNPSQRSNTYLSVSGFVTSVLDRPDYFYEGSVDQLLTGRVKVVDGVARYTLELFAMTGLNTVYQDRFGTFGRDSGGTLDFMHSMSLLSVVGLAADGSRVALTGAVGTTGFDYLSVTAAPEPATCALWLGGLAALAARRRRTGA